MEAWATAHYWARELTKLGHEVRLMPAKDVKAYVERNKNDAADAEAICEAVRRPTMRFVRIKSAEQQGQLMQHRRLVPYSTEMPPQSVGPATRAIEDFKKASPRAWTQSRVRRRSASTR